MSDYFQGVTFEQQLVTPADDAALNAAILPDGVIYGCAISYSGTTLTMNSGLLLIAGRVIRHTAAQAWNISEESSGLARVVLTIDLSKPSSEDSFEQVFTSVEYSASLTGFPVLEKSSINIDGTRYQTELCVVTLGSGRITGITQKLQTSELRFSFAPSGYGLGEESAVELASGDPYKSGWYLGSQPTVPGEVAFLGKRLIRADVATPDYRNHTMYLADNNIIRRCVVNDVPQPWEFENPPMWPGYVYRTTQRHNGKPVYAVCLELGDLPNSGTVSASIPDVVETLVELTGIASSEEYSEKSAFPVITARGTVGASLKLSGESTVRVKTFDDYSSYTAMAIVKYTRS